MQEKGRVVNLENRRASVVLDRKKRSSGCSQCNLCSRDRQGRLVLEAEDGLGVNIGDLVDVEVDDLSVLKATILVYGLPLAGFLLGVFSWIFIGPVYLKIAVFLIIFLGLWRYGLNKADALSRRGESAKIVAVRKKET